MGTTDKSNNIALAPAEEDWGELESIKPYSQEGDKTKQVTRMFDNIAPHYDMFTHSTSLGIDNRWRRKAIDALRPFAPKAILDVATGTGDFALLAADRLHPDTIVGVDISDGMMSIAKDKVETRNHRYNANQIPPTVITFQHEDCESLSFPDNTFDVVMSSYGVRNFAHLDRCLSEMLRVLRPGGHLLIVELSAPRHFPMRQLFWLYSHVLMALLGWIVSGDRKAFTYLPASMEAFPQGEQMQQILQSAGFCNVSFNRFTFGLSTMYLAEK